MTNEEYEDAVSALDKEFFELTEELCEIHMDGNFFFVMRIKGIEDDIRKIFDNINKDTENDIENFDRERYKIEVYEYFKENKDKIPLWVDKMRLYLL